jgi:hypothetical protein
VERLLEFVRQTAGASLSPARVLTFPAPAGDALLSGLIALLPRFEARAAA